MSVCFVTFRSITYAQRGQGVLGKAGIAAGFGRTPRWMEEKGCGYSLRVPRGRIQEAATLLRDNGVPFSKIYCAGQDGTMEELP